jgi:hypothetical protein
MIPTPTESYLGDSALLAIPLTWQGRPFNPTGWHLIFTVKSAGTLPDTAALLQKDSNNGIEIRGTTALITLVPQDSATAAPGTYAYDIQAQNIATSEVRTLSPGQHTFRRDITRETTTSVPVYTTAPGVPGLIPVVLRTTAQGPPTDPGLTIGQFSRVGDTSPYDWYRWDGTTWEDLATGGGGGSGTVTSVAISATGLTVTGSPVTTTGTITLAVQYGTTAGTACQGNDARLSDARTPTAHKSTHATGGTDALTPADIGALATSDATTTASADKVAKRDANGKLSMQGALLLTAETGVCEVTEDTGQPRLTVGSIVIDSATGTINGLITPTTDELYFAATSRSDGKTVPHELAPASENVIAAGFTLSVATHANKINVLDSGGSAIAISVPDDIPAGHEFVFWRGSTGALSFTGAGVVTGEARLADVVPNSFFGLVSRGSGQLLFV